MQHRPLLMVVVHERAEHRAELVRLLPVGRGHRIGNRIRQRDSARTDEDEPSLVQDDERLKIHDAIGKRRHIDHGCPGEPRESILDGEIGQHPFSQPE